MVFRIYRMDRSGHGTLAEWQEGDPGAVARASETFSWLRSCGYSIARMDDAEGTFVREFDPAAGDYLAVPQLVGG